ncbi:hypothetical protein SAMN05444266_101619 [Chitinophaga jiangningensis]|uniref:Fibronectin type-III domain-containing protein n=1 Tax=Chitinophaga jiangningensis TaxID=1419482 RepID=A0A1M6WGT6_9BACT|nr:fibronectin type III domain-containing protein [Chitinophaga jiangningensis]SHK92891.1 hypothetical protein SAMN05444266_101619 [Chitinophaga jiangningensis]
MPITSIVTQPGAASLKGAYQEIQYAVTAIAPSGETPAIIWCDIYFGNVYYKSLSTTILITGAWRFDIQDAAQEYLRSALAPNGAGDVFLAAKSLTKVFCRFRVGFYDTNGFITSEGTVPVQATGTLPAVSGTGLQSSTSFIVNSALQHEDNPDLPQHLFHYKSGVWAEKTHPLTHRPAPYKVGSGNSDYFPLVHLDNSPLKCIRLNYRFEGQTGFQQRLKCYPIPCPVITPVLLGIIINADSTQTISLGWQQLPPYATGVKVKYRKTNTADTLQAQNVIGASIAITLPLGKYDFYFTAIGDCTQVDDSTMLAIGEDRNPCQPVSGLAVTRISANIWRVSWNVVSGSSGYYLYYKKDTDPDFSQIFVPGNSYDFNNPEPNRTYTIKVSNYCNPWESDLSEITTFNVPSSYTLKLNLFAGGVSTYITEYDLAGINPISNSAGRIQGAGSNAGSSPSFYLFEKIHNDRAATAVRLHVYSSNGKQIVGNYQLFMDGVLKATSNVNTPNNTWINIPVELFNANIVDLKLNF